MHTKKRKVCVPHLFVACALSPWSGTKPARSPRCACCSKSVHWAHCKPGALLSSSHGLSYLILITTMWEGLSLFTFHKRKLGHREVKSNLLKTRHCCKGRSLAWLQTVCLPTVLCCRGLRPKETMEGEVLGEPQGTIPREANPHLPPGGGAVSRVMCYYVRPWSCAFFQCVKEDAGTLQTVKKLLYCEKKITILWKNHCT